MSLTSYRAAPPRGCMLCCWNGWIWHVMCLAIFCVFSVQGRPGGDLLSRGLSRSTIGAGGFHFRVRDGIGWIFPRHSHQAVLEQKRRLVEARCRFCSFWRFRVFVRITGFRILSNAVCTCFISASTDVFSRLSVAASLIKDTTV